MKVTRNPLTICAVRRRRLDRAIARQALCRAQMRRVRSAYITRGIDYAVGVVLYRLETRQVTK